MRQVLKKLTVCFSFVFLVSCGQSFCVMGFGQCDAPEKPQTTPQTTTQLSLTTSKASLGVNQQATLTISGGTPNYKLEFDGAGFGTLSGTPGIFSSQTTYTYTASTQTGTVTFKVTDSSVPAVVKRVSIVVE
jgi:hypothetical protein